MFGEFRKELQGIACDRALTFFNDWHSGLQLECVLVLTLSGLFKQLSSGAPIVYS